MPILYRPLLPSASVAAAALAAVVILAMASASSAQQLNATMVVLNQAGDYGTEYLMCINPDMPESVLKLDYQLPVGDQVVVNLDARRDAESNLCGVLPENLEDRVLVLYDSRNPEDRRRCLAGGCTMAVRLEGLFWQTKDGWVLLRGFQSLDSPLGPAPQPAIVIRGSD